MKSIFSRKKQKDKPNAAATETAKSPKDPPLGDGEQPPAASKTSSPSPPLALSPTQTPHPAPALVPHEGISGPSSLAGSHAVLPVAHAAVVPPRAFPLTPRGSTSQSLEGMATVHAGPHKMVVPSPMAKTAPLHPQMVKGPLPPGAKLIHGGALPPGVKLMKGPVPPGAKLIKGPPPPGLMKKMGPPPGVSPKQMMHSPQQIPLKIIPGAKSPTIAPPRLPPRKVSPKFFHPKFTEEGHGLLSPPSPPLLLHEQEKQSLSRSGSRRHSSLVANISSGHQEKQHNSNSLGENVDGEDHQLQVPGVSIKRNDDIVVVPSTPRNDSDSDNELKFVIEPDSVDDLPQAKKDNHIMRKFSRSASNASSLQFHAEESRNTFETIGARDSVTAKPQGNRSSLQSSRRSSQSREFTHGVASAGTSQTERRKSITKEDDHIDVRHTKQHRTSSIPTPSKEEYVRTPKEQQIKKEDKKDVSEARSSLTPLRLDKTLSRKNEDDFSSIPLVLPEEHSEEEVLTAVSDSKLSSSVRSRVAEQFLSILCPQQFYGKVTKIHRIRLVKSDPERVPGIKEHNTIYVATKGVLPNQFFYPQLRLKISDGSPVSDNESPGSLDTPIVLYEAAPGNMLFADTELEAKHIMETNTTANSCFVLEKSAIVFREPQKYALPIAMLTVRWIPYTVPESEPQCPVHHKELQLFDRYTKELLCALCVSKNGANTSELVVIPDVLNGDSRRRITETLTRQLQQGEKTAVQWVSQHKRIVSIAKHKKDAVNQQFDMLLAAIKSKREEYLEQCDATFGFALSTVAKEILMADEKIRLLKAGIDHLRTESTKPLYSMQIATVANALYASDEFPNSFSIESLKIPVLTNELTPNLETAMSDIQQLSPTISKVNINRPRSPFGIRSKDDEIQEEDLQQGKNHHNNHHHHYHELHKRHDKADQRQKRVGIISSRNQSSSRSMRESNHRRKSLLRSNSNSIRSDGSRALSLRQSMPLIPRNVSTNYMPEEGGTFSRIRDSGEWIALPGCRGTCLLDVSINEMLKEEDDVRSSRTKPKYLQWTLKVNDPGEWVGIGVGVGSSPQSWCEGQIPDLSHLWLVTCGNTRHTFTLRVTLNPSVGHAKLSIHDQKGRQLDDGRIPQWNAARTCYPQVTFGGRIGEVNLIEGPHVVFK
ncbi:uncharacterized protein TM35_000172100 [Trypanosoma theileri]|uniref:Uncharacterized protein n=1 Tax=Trypanosoma theileri TaxID=67003 RepID=A0A1X0NUW6_9TRYP|nr:uncharacterized protein TM35_000172100 [Trypanosoma theileri]ORC88338.1 hypothetical protein TM35_000172100 [Trypanosoma theileri]